MAKKTAFFVTPIGKERSEPRERADRILEYVLNPILANNYDIVRADHVTSIGSINHDIIHRLHASDLVIADLTGANANVMYEIGIRHAFNLPIVQLCQNDQELPFDLGTERTIFFDLSDVKDVDQAKRRLKTTVVTAMSENYLGPVQRTLGLSAIYRKDKTVAEAIDTLSEKIEELEASVTEMLVFDVAVEAKLPDDETGKLQHIYDVLASVRPYEAERMFDTLRRLAFKKE